MKSFLVLYTALSYSLYLSFIVVSWTRPQDIYDQTPREKGFIQYYVDSYISEKLLLTLTLGILIFPPFVCGYFYIKWLVTSVKDLYIYINKVYRSDNKWFF